MVAPRTWALLAHECRLLRQNRFACVAILTALVAAFLYRQAGPRLEAMVEGGCTVVYWQEDDWVRALRSAAEEAAGGFRVFAGSFGDDRQCWIGHQPSVDQLLHGAGRDHAAQRCVNPRQQVTAMREQQPVALVMRIGWQNRDD